MNKNLVAYEFAASLKALLKRYNAKIYEDNYKKLFILSDSGELSFCLSDLIEEPEQVITREDFDFDVG